VTATMPRRTPYFNLLTNQRRQRKAHKLTVVDDLSAEPISLLLPAGERWLAGKD
jgi:hypothetical protein